MSRTRDGRTRTPAAAKLARFRGLRATGNRARGFRSCACIGSVHPVPLLSGSRVVIVPADDDDVVLRPPPPPEQVVDIAAAVRDALRFPLAGPALDAVAPRGGRATIVVEPPALPLPGVHLDPRREALAAAIGELERCGIPDERQTILVAGGLGRRLGQRELERLLPPPQARSLPRPRARSRCRGAKARRPHGCL